MMPTPFSQNSVYCQYLTMRIRMVDVLKNDVFNCK